MSTLATSSVFEKGEVQIWAKLAFLPHSSYELRSVKNKNWPSGRHLFVDISAITYNNSMLLIYHSVINYTQT